MIAIVPFSSAHVVIDIATRRLVRERARGRCEYCRLPQSAVDAAFHVEHIVPRQHHGPDDADNLALACDRC
jgi:5-methylcytosine-specific restriction endonuclease McrA